MKHKKIINMKSSTKFWIVMIGMLLIYLEIKFYKIVVIDMADGEVILVLTLVNIILWILLEAFLDLNDFKSSPAKFTYKFIKKYITKFNEWVDKNEIV